MCGWIVVGINKLLRDVGIFRLFVGFLAQQMAESILEVVRNHLCKTVGVGNGKAHYSGNVTDGVFGCHCTKCYNLANVVGTVLFVHVVDNFATAVHTKVDVEVGHGLTLWVQKALEHQIEAERLNLGDADEVGNYTTCATTTARANGDAICLGVVDEVPNDKVVVHKAHVANNFVLVFDAFTDFCSFHRVLFLEAFF